jgi:hypothetical protein
MKRGVKITTFTLAVLFAFIFSGVLVFAYSNNYIKICGDRGCNEVGPVFGAKSSVYIYIYGTNLSTINGTLTAPGNKKVRFTFQRNIATIPTPMKGAYSGEVTYKYNRNERYIPFRFVVGEASNIIDLSNLCNLNNICDGDETIINCPQDCGEISECVPKTCDELGRQCGGGDDGCGGTVTCGTCPAGSSCNSTGQCVASATCMSMGDLNNDCVINALDLQIVISNFGKTTSVGDVNGDGVVNALDLQVIQSNFGKTCTGCSGGGAPVGCVAKTCSQLGKTCGTWDNGCNKGVNALGCITCPTGSSCNSTGQCVSSGGGGGGVLRCTDSDANAQYSDGNNPFVKGTTKGYNLREVYGSVTDVCVDSTKIMEAFCQADGKHYAVTNTLCANGCTDGACKSSGGSCTDSDNGLNYSVKGFVTFSSGGIPTQYNDFCVSNTLYELVCDNAGQKVQVGHNCPTGQTCNDGACKSASGDLTGFLIKIFGPGRR